MAIHVIQSQKIDVLLDAYYNEEMTLDELEQELLHDINQLKKTIKEGVQKGVWIYYVGSEGMGYGPPSPAPVVEISEDATLYTPEEAARVGIKIKGAEPVEEMCPVCKKFPCVCGEDDGGGDDKPEKIRKVSGEGTPAQAFQAIAENVATPLVHSGLGLHGGVRAT